MLSELLEERYRPGRVVFLGDGKRSAHLHLHLIPESAWVTLFFVQHHTPLHFLLYGSFGTVTGFAAGWAAILVLPGKRRTSPT